MSDWQDVQCQEGALQSVCSFFFIRLVERRTGNTPSHKIIAYSSSYFSF